jgi:hypothetical protein
MFYLTVVFEKGDVVDCGLDTKDERKLVVHFDRNRSHGVFDTGAFNADIEAVTHFVLLVAVKLAAEERGDVVGLDGVNGGSGEIVVNGSQVGLASEDHIGGVLGLVDAPVIDNCKMFKDRTKTAIAPRFESTSLMRSSLRKFFLRMYSISMP